MRNDLLGRDLMSPDKSRVADPGGRPPSSDGGSAWSAVTIHPIDTRRSP